MAVVLTLIVVSVAQWRGRDRLIGAALAEGRGHLAARRYAEAVVALDRGLALAQGLPDHDTRRKELESTRLRVVRAKEAAELHSLVNRLRFWSGIGPLSADEARSLLAVGQRLWDSRDLLTRPSGEPIDRKTAIRSAPTCSTWRPPGRPPGPPRPRRGTGRGTPRRRQRAPRRRDPVRPQPRPEPGPPQLRPRLGRSDVPAVEIPAPRTAWEHYELGRSFLRSGEFQAALVEFRWAVEMQPGEFWPYFSQAACAYHLGQYQDAVASLTVCVALSPRTPECYYNRAVAYEALNQPARAVADYSQALAWNPGFREAAFNRGLLSALAGRYAEAADDFRLARPALTESVPSDFDSPSPTSPAVTCLPPGPASAEPPSAATPPLVASRPASARGEVNQAKKLWRLAGGFDRVFAAVTNFRRAPPPLPSADPWEGGVNRLASIHATGPFTRRQG